MARGKAQFSGKSNINVANFDKKIMEAVLKFIPGLFEEIDLDDPKKLVVERSDFAGVLAEIQGAAWLAKHMIEEGRLENSVPDIRAELATLMRWVDRGELEKIRDKLPNLSHDVWWVLQTAKKTGSDSDFALVTSLRESISLALYSEIAARPRPDETNSAAAKLLVQRLRNVLLPHQVSLGVTLTAYYNPAYGNSISTLIALAEAVGSEIYLCLSLLRWRDIAQQVIGDIRNGVDDAAIP